DILPKKENKLNLVTKNVANYQKKENKLNLSSEAWCLDSVLVIPFLVSECGELQKKENKLNLVTKNVANYQIKENKLNLSSDLASECGELNLVTKNMAKVADTLNLVTKNMANSDANAFHHSLLLYAQRFMGH
ncbi:hypothetical protein ACJX0J_025837, partial [Zea mays]